MLTCENTRIWWKQKGTKLFCTLIQCKRTSHHIHMPWIRMYVCNVNGEHECNLLIFVFCPLSVAISQHYTQCCSPMNSIPIATSSSFLTLVYFLLLQFRRKIFAALSPPKTKPKWFNSMFCSFVGTMTMCVSLIRFHINSLEIRISAIESDFQNDRS